jgi:thiamine-monophosphate kinase
MAGDRLYVSGTIGDAALGLKLLRAPGLGTEWVCRTMRRFFSSIVTAARRRGMRLRLLRQCARAAMTSRMVVATQAKLCQASGVSATIEAARVRRLSGKAVAQEAELLAELITAGDD